MTETLERTPLYDWHAQRQARLVDFAGWSMPIQYDSIVQEHRRTRNAVGLFDVSHMGRFCFAGPGAAPLLDGILSRGISKLKAGQVRYALVTNDAGGVLDDVLVSHLVVGSESFFWLVVNASNREKIKAWISSRIGKYDVRFTDETTRTAMIAIQGPRSLELVDAMFDGAKPSDLAYYHAANGMLHDIPVTVSRTGYTGEDGVEFILPSNRAMDIWNELHSFAEEVDGGAVGLGARDTLRLEAGMPLYGHELTEDINPFEARLGFAVQLNDRVFPGCEHLRAAQSDPRRVRVGLTLEGRRAARQGYAILSENQTIGTVSSGTFSPTLDQPIAMGFVAPEFADAGSLLDVDVRGNRVPAKVVELPFYRRK